ADKLKKLFGKWSKADGWDKKMAESFKGVQHTSYHRLQVYKEWVRTFVKSFGHTELLPYSTEAAVSLMAGNTSTEKQVKANTYAEIKGLVGEHPLIKEGSYAFDFSGFMEKMDRFHNDSVM